MDDNVAAKEEALALPELTGSDIIRRVIEHDDLVEDKSVVKLGP